MRSFNHHAFIKPRLASGLLIHHRGDDTWCGWGLVGGSYTSENFALSLHCSGSSVEEVAIGRARVTRVRNAYGIWLRNLVLEWQIQDLDEDGWF